MLDRTLPALVRCGAATVLLLIAMGSSPLAAADRDQCPDSYTEVHRWVPGYTEITPDGDHIHHDGYWVVTRRPVVTGDAGDDQVVVRDPDAGACAGGDVVYAPAPGPRLVVVAPCPPLGCGWGSCAEPWRDPSCVRGSIAVGGEREGHDGGERHGHDHGGGHWLPPLPPLPRLSQLPRLPFALLSMLGHLHR